MTGWQPARRQTAIYFKAGTVTTAEKINIGVALAAALGVGALIHALLGHRLNRDERKANIADKFMQMATAMTTGLGKQLSHVQVELRSMRTPSCSLSLKQPRQQAWRMVSGSGALDERRDQLPMRLIRRR
ncbi:hypothetical protein C7C45_06060 [Micromonospora arborensis]|uniref:Uncharacterized protein n=1 Tax=Micromonospora arborensis TaxID=2116518 RepID=A0A318NN34_9ACTN|nr:hypothetical protein C7C45_06060 [Micromonospora arborensis]